MNDKNNEAIDLIDEISIEDLDKSIDLKTLDKKLVETKNIIKKSESKKPISASSLKKVFKWYLISTVNGKEEKVREALLHKIISAEMDGIIKEVKIFTIPHLTKKELEKYRNGDTDYVVKKKNLYPSYMFLNINMTDNAWFLVRNTEFVTGLIGSSGRGAKPTPISSRRWKMMLEHEEAENKKFFTSIDKLEFAIGELVKVTKAGSYLDTSGPIVEIDAKEKTAFIPLEQFGRKVNVEFNFSDLEHVEKK